MYCLYCFFNTPMSLYNNCYDLALEKDMIIIIIPQIKYLFIQIINRQSENK